MLCDAVAVCYAGNSRFEQLRKDIETRLEALASAASSTR
jgi:hypothetical protein